MSQKVSVVDDEHPIVTLLKYGLETAGYEVAVTFGGDETLEGVESEQPDLVILDAMLPKKDGTDVYKTVGTNKNLVLILMLTTKNNEFDQVLGLGLGVDDCMIKSFSPGEVVIRMKAILRCSQFVKEIEEINDNITIGSICIRPGYFEVYKHSELLELTPKRSELLLYLIEKQGRVIAREHMLDTVWNYEFVGGSRIVGVHISHLRDKLEDNPKKPQLIKTMHGLGHRLERPREQ